MDKKRIAELVDDFRNGKDSAAGELYGITYRKLNIYAVSIVSNREQADEIVQDTYIRAFSRISQLSDPEKFYPWTKRILHNLAMDRFRKMKNDPLLLDEDHENMLEMEPEERDEFIPEEKIDREELSSIMYELMHTIPVEQRVVILAYYYDNMPISDIAVMTDSPEGTVKSRLYNGRKAFREKLEAYEKKHDIRLHSIAPLMGIGLKDLETKSAPLVSKSIKSFGTIAKAAGIDIGSLPAAEPVKTYEVQKFPNSSRDSAIQTRGQHAVRKAGKAAAGSAAKKITAGIIAASLAAGGGAFGVHKYKKAELTKDWKYAYAEVLGEKIRKTEGGPKFYAAVKDINKDDIPEVAIAWNGRKNKADVYTFDPGQNVENEYGVKKYKKADVSSSDFSLKSFDGNRDLADFLDDKLELSEASDEIDIDLSAAEMKKVVNGTWELWKVDEENYSMEEYIPVTLTFSDRGTLTMTAGSAYGNAFGSGRYSISGNDGDLVMKVDVSANGNIYNLFNENTGIEYANGKLTVTYRGGRIIKAVYKKYRRENL